MTIKTNHFYYLAIQQASFDLEELIGSDAATILRSQLSEILETKEGELKPEQITKALEVIRPHKAFREKVRSYVEKVWSVRSGFDSLPGEVTWVGDPPVEACLLICPVDGEKLWDIPLHPNERRLCLKHRVYFAEAGPLDQYRTIGE